jgi:2-methylcitrate dehydratase PrpD
VSATGRKSARSRKLAFSTRLTVATMLFHSGLRLAGFAPDRLAEPVIRAIMPRVTVGEDAECTAAFTSAATRARRSPTPSRTRSS